MPKTEINGAQLHYHVQGKGTPFVFLHPPCIGSRVFTYLWNDLGQDHRTLRYDFRGHGHSPPSEEKLTIPLLAEDAVRLMDRLDMRKAYLCGYSTGSLVALEALLGYPDRFFGAVMLSGMAQTAGSKTAKKLWWGSMAARMKAKEILVLPQLWSNADSIPTYRRLRGETNAGHMANWRQYMESAHAYSAVSRLAEIAQPVLAIYGEKDEECRKHAQTLRQGLPNVATVALPGQKHTLPTHDASPAADHIRHWIDVVEGRRPAEGEEAGNPDFHAPYEPVAMGQPAPEENRTQI